MKQVLLPFFTSLILVSFSILSSPTLAQDGGVFEDTEADPVPTREIQGRVIRKENNRIFVETEEEVREISVPSNIAVTRNGSEANINEIELNDRVTVMISGTGQVLSLEATSGQVFDTAKWLIPLLLIGLVLLGLITYFVRKGQQPKIKTEARQTP